MDESSGLPTPWIKRNPPSRIRRWCYFFPMARSDPDPVRAALEEAVRRPLPPPEERERIMGLVRARMKGPFLTTEEFLAKLPSLHRAALARGMARGMSPGPERDQLLALAAESDLGRMPSAAE
jgi:hypothetical protein